jgi:hypothetical protein
MHFNTNWRVAALVLGAVAAVGSPLQAAEPPPPPAPVSPPSAASPTSAPATWAVPIDRWLVVTASAGKGLKVGGGVRLRKDGFDTAEGEKGSASASECSSTAEIYSCSNGLQAKPAAGGAVQISMGPVSVTAAPASAADSQRFSAWLAAQLAQQKACSDAAKCCIAAEKLLGKPCDLNAVLGDRKLPTCQAALAQTRAALATAKAAVPAVCGN